MGRKKKNRKPERLPRDSYGNKYAESKPLVSAENVATILKKPLDVSVHAPVNYTGKYAKLYEDYDDR